MIKSISTFLALAFSFSFTSLYAQPNEQYNSSDIQQSIKKLNVLGSVLYIAAHPDDENTRLITYYTKDKLYNTAYLSLTRGDGGQNLIGKELNEQLGIIRTQELLEARKIDGGKQFFSRANDFGFSKHPDETFKIWNRDEVLADMVWVIRKFRPDVLITRFNTEPGRTHGHHTASAILALEAFSAAANPTRFPEQLKYVETWQPKRVLWNTNSWFYANENEFKKDSMLKVDVGEYNQMLGKSYTEIAAESRSMHKSQGFGASGTRGSSIEYLEHLKGPKAKQDIFEDIDLSWARVRGGEKVSSMITKVYKNFNPDNPAASIDALLEIRKTIQTLPNDYWKKVKLEELEDIIKRCLGFWTEATAADFSVVPGEKIKVTIELINRSSIPAEVKKISYVPSMKDTTEDFFEPHISRDAIPLNIKKTDDLLSIKDTLLSLSLSKNSSHIHNSQLNLPKDISYTQPYWLAYQGTKGMFMVDNQGLIGLPENPPAIKVLVTTSIKGQLIEFETPLVFKKTDPVKGEQYRPFEITPPYFINFNEDLLIFADDKLKTISLTVKSSKDNISQTLALRLPKGWRSEPMNYKFELAKKGSEKTFSFKISPSANQMSDEILAIGYAPSDSLATANSLGVTTISYDHIPAQTLFPAASVKVVKLDLKKKGENIGYIMGAGDEIPSSLAQIGYKVTILKEEAITEEILQKFDAIIIGIRAFNTQDRLKFFHPLLLKYVYNGGRLVAQYNTLPPRFLGGKMVTDSIGPYPFKISNERVTVEEAEMRILNPQHSLLNTPNKITQKDFENWVQERGLYFPNEWSKQYETIVSCNDPGETPKDSGILYTKYGKGVFIYTSLSWFRQLPEGVPGAYRLFVNLISSGK